MRAMGLADVISRITGLFALLGQLLLFLNFPLLLVGRAPISWLAVLLLIAAPRLSALLQLALSRTREFQADLGAARLTGDPEGLASALRKMEAYQSGIWKRILMPGGGGPNPSLFRTHPATGERVRRLLELVEGGRPAASLPAASLPHESPVYVPVRFAPETPRQRWHITRVWS